MSTLVAQTISNGTVSTSSANVIQGSAKAWVRFNGLSGAVINASYNVSSVVRTSTGNYNINFTNAFVDTNYAVCGSGRDSQGPVMTIGSLSVNSISTAFIVPNVAVQDCSTASVIVFR